MNLAHFIHGQFGKDGYRLFKSRDLTQKISEETLIDLSRQGGGLNGEVIRVSYRAKENMIAVSYLRSTNDEISRSGVWNHTILISVEDYLKLTNASKLFESFFIRELKEPPRNPILEPIEVEECPRNNGS